MGVETLGSDYELDSVRADPSPEPTTPTCSDLEVRDMRCALSWASRQLTKEKDLAYWCFLTAKIRGGLEYDPNNKVRGIRLSLHSSIAGCFTIRPRLTKITGEEL
jgi:hypothetical protein